LDFYWKSLFLIWMVGLIYVLVVCLSHLLRFLIFYKIVAFLGVTTTFSSFMKYVSSGGRMKMEILSPFEIGCSIESDRKY